MKTRELNVGCGNNIRKGWVNIDIIPPYDKKVDLNKKPYPFKDNSFDYILLDNVLEHLEKPINCLEELHRICSPKGGIEIIVPFYNSPNAFRDITHKIFFNLDSLNDFDINVKDRERRYTISKKRFIIEKKLNPSVIGKIIPKPLLNIFALSMGNLVDTITFKLRPVKDENSITK